MANSSNPQSIFTLPFQDISKFVSIILKNDGSNYLTWKYQFQCILKATDLYGFVDGTTLIPDEFISAGFSSHLSPEFVQWRKTNGFIMSCFNVTFDDVVSRSVIGKTTAQEVWLFLEDEFVQRFFAKKCLLHRQLQLLRRGNSCISEYLDNLKVITDSLDAIGETVEESDIVWYALRGLGNDYSQFVVSAHTREVGYTLAELRSRLRCHEQWLQIETLESSLMVDSQSLASCSCQIRKKGHTTNRCYSRHVPLQSIATVRGGEVSYERTLPQIQEETVVVDSNSLNGNIDICEEQPLCVQDDSIDVLSLSTFTHELQIFSTSILFSSCVVDTRTYGVNNILEDVVSCVQANSKLDTKFSVVQPDWKCAIKYVTTEKIISGEMIHRNLYLIWLLRQFAYILKDNARKVIRPAPPDVQSPLSKASLIVHDGLSPYNEDDTSNWSFGSTETSHMNKDFLLLKKFTSRAESDNEVTESGIMLSIQGSCTITQCCTTWVFVSTTSCDSLDGIWFSYQTLQVQPQVKISVFAFRRIFYNLYLQAAPPSNGLLLLSADNVHATGVNSLLPAAYTTSASALFDALTKSVHMLSLCLSLSSCMFHLMLLYSVHKFKCTPSGSHVWYGAAQESTMRRNCFTTPVGSRQCAQSCSISATDKEINGSLLQGKYSKLKHFTGLA